MTWQLHFWEFILEKLKLVFTHTDETVQHY